MLGQYQACDSSTLAGSDQRAEILGIGHTIESQQEGVGGSRCFTERGKGGSWQLLRMGKYALGRLGSGFQAQGVHTGIANRDSVSGAELEDLGD